MERPQQQTPPDLSVRNVSQGLLFASVGVVVLALLLLSPIRTVEQEFAVSQGAPFLPGSMNRIFYGAPCAADLQACADSEVALLASNYMSPLTLQVMVQAYRNKPFKTLCLFSPGGSVRATIDLANWLKQAGVSLCVAEAFITDANLLFDELYCYSSCAILFASGHTRLAFGAQPVIGVHDIYYQQAIPLSDKTFRAESDFLALAMDYRLTKLDIPYRTLRAFFTPKSSEIYELTVADMTELNLLTEHYQAGSSF